MTTIWKIPSNYFDGQTVVVLGTGPSLTKEIAEDAMKYKTIAIHRAIRFALKADILFSLDGKWSKEFRDFKGLKVTGCEDETLDAMYIGLCYERICVSKNQTVEVRQSGLAAIRLAANGGAKRILLAGFDPDTSAHFHDSTGADKPYPYLAKGLESIIKELSEKGIVVKKYQMEEKAQNKIEEPKKQVRRSRYKKNG